MKIDFDNEEIWIEDLDSIEKLINIISIHNLFKFKIRVKDTINWWYPHEPTNDNTNYYGTQVNVKDSGNSFVGTTCPKHILRVY